ncbi:MAG: mechanosensitive ion channel family protein [Ilumatobacteraceae bacterium]
MPWAIVTDITARAAAELDPDLVNACGDRPSWFCEGAWNLTHNHMLARAADWIVTRPLVALIVLLVAWLLNRYLRKAATAFVTRLATSRQLANEALQRIGVDRPDAATVIDARQRSRASTLAAVSRASVSWFVWTIAVLIVLGLFHINLGPLLAGAGIAGIAVGFGAQTLVKDCISGFFILLEDQCGVGDEVDLGEAIGTVESITLRMTSVRGLDGTLWSVPNGAIQRVGNRTRSWSQGLVDITVWYDGDLDDALAAVHQGIAVASEVPAVAEVLLQPPAVLGVERIDASGTVVRITVRTRPGKQWAAMREVRLAIRRSLVEHGIPLHPPMAPGRQTPPTT